MMNYHKNDPSKNGKKIADLYFDDINKTIDGREYPVSDYYTRQYHSTSMNSQTHWRDDPDYFSYKHKKVNQLIK